MRPEIAPGQWSEITSQRSSGRRRILLIGINYAPEVVGIAPYTTRLAEHFAAQGHLVRVMTGIPHNPTWRRMPFTRNGARNPLVNRYSHFIPARPSAAGRAVYEATWLLSASRGLVNRRCDVAIGVVPSLSGGVLAWMASRRFGVPFGLIFQDLPRAAAVQSGYRGAHRIARVAGQLEQALAQRAHRVGIISDGFRSYLEGLGVSPARIERLRNWVHLQQPSESVKETRMRLGWESTEYVCLHTGNMGQKQGLDNLILAARHLQGERVRIVLSGDGNDKTNLVLKTKALGLTNISFVPLQPAGRYESMLRAADVVLLNQRATVREMALPGKLTSYFASGRPIIAAVTSDSDAAEEIRASQAGIVVSPNDPEALAAAVLKLRDHRQHADRLGLAGTEYASSLLTEPHALAAYDDFLERLADPC